MKLTGMSIFFTWSPVASLHEVPVRTDLALVGDSATGPPPGPPPAGAAVEKRGLPEGLRPSVTTTDDGDNISSCEQLCTPWSAPASVKTKHQTGTMNDDYLKSKVSIVYALRGNEISQLSGRYT
mmetsp:Transcript_25707/g.55879  ORF Transcript_25707/g.55879 Transcript_25707/m.55879 type:complete len:124 (+) Transcript_25707:964-1335(+)